MPSPLHTSLTVNFTTTVRLKRGRDGLASYRCCEFSICVDAGSADAHLSSASLHGGFVSGTSLLLQSSGGDGPET
ncbi:hypothetical protein E2C01_088602 [Portunus trituberculatus]|uniref:Uncharacterized protein n=1 Tax=Portunus trituberculatus TaxID=210409 RepID=A0A5B7JMC1_PORTR|nr:hypothetical protein [Portunus trituberculatus]